VILDYDGTLTPLVSSPGAAFLAPSVRANLARLASPIGAPRHPVGRGLDGLRERVALDNVVYGGCRARDRRPRLHFRHPRAHRSGVAATSAPWPPRSPGAGRAAGVQGTGREPALSPWCAGAPSAVREIAERCWPAPDLLLIAGHLVFDFMPRIGWHKGTAAQWMVSRLVRTLPARRAVIVYAGDDASDEMAFAALRGRALTIHVGSKPTAAEYRVRGVRDVQALLHRMVTALAS
jgi:trehalose 6-phosphate phosphatase